MTSKEDFEKYLGANEIDVFIQEIILALYEKYE